ncbi:diguanylate cyclase domain-containing protein [Mycoplana sp. BE70]|uniref:diguanylate cyclase domain-containing protein n=1 Tax=Mycoplana sp. BE70 TaxID=2817775 RepID=UPI0038621BBC
MLAPRVGGKEFGVLLCGHSPGEAARCVEGSRRHRATTHFLRAGEDTVTISAGLADSRADRAFEDLSSHADRALDTSTSAQSNPRRQ